MEEKPPPGYAAVPQNVPYSAPYAPQYPQNVHYSAPQYPQYPNPAVSYAGTGPNAPVSVTYGQPAAASNVIVINLAQLGPDPISMQCPNCKEQIQSVPNRVPTAWAWMTAILIALMGCFCGCCLIPFYTDCLQDVEHRCPKCSHYIGLWRRPMYDRWGRNVN